MQIEVAAQLKNAPNPDGAQQFMDFITSKKFQSAIPTGNWMYPVVELPDGLPAAFDELFIPRGLIIDPQKIHTNKSNWVDEFIRAFE